MGFPIRKCPDQSLFAAPRTLSQRTTSFIASQRQGIHRIPLRHLIVLIDNATPLGSGPTESHRRMTSLAKTRMVTNDQNLLANVPEPLRGQAEAQHKPQAGHGLHEPLGMGQPRSEHASLSTMTNSTRTDPSQGRTRPQTSMSSTLNQDEPTNQPVEKTAPARAPDTPDRPRSIWWSQTGSNRRPHACKARALPTELWPHTRAASVCLFAFGKARAMGRGGQSTLRACGPSANDADQGSLVRRTASATARRGTCAFPDQHGGPGKLELPTSRLSGVRSNQLSYRPEARDAPALRCSRRRRPRVSPKKGSSGKKEKRGRQSPA